jgi:hypothetical protein
MGILFISCCTWSLSCSKQEDPKKFLPLNGSHPTILIAQAQFETIKTDNGQTMPRPGPALLSLKQKTPGGWHDIAIEDPQSNVFHKALIFQGKGSTRSILTIGAMDAALKVWHYRAKKWQHQTLWNPVFGGKWNRLRDMEIGDVTGDGSPDMVIATHDQGVVAVARNKNQKWEIEEIDREPGIFVHEVEIGDVDGDGLNEFFATPSKPNKSMGGPQPGKVVMYQWDGSRFKKTVVDSFPNTHAKEILTTDLNGNGRATLFGVIEAEMAVQDGKTVRLSPVKIKEYLFQDGRIKSTVVATIEDRQCRFLTAGDVDGDGQKELVASAMTSGIWLLKQHSDQSWGISQIDAFSSGYEHATLITDLDGNDIDEIYVASDDQGELREYVWNGKGFSKTVLSSIANNCITWNLTAGVF